MKWQEYLESVSDPNADDETVRTRLFDVLKAETLTLEAERSTYSDPGQCSEYDVKGLMADIYQDLQDVAESQVHKSTSVRPQTGRIYLGDLDDVDRFLRAVSACVTFALSKSLQLPSLSMLANRSTETAFAYIHSPENPQGSEVWDSDERMAGCPSNQDPIYERYGKLLLTERSDRTWKFLAKLFHSTAFCEAACTLDDSKWQAVSASIDENAVSLMVFIECNGLRWWDELVHLNTLFPPSPPQDLTKYQTEELPKATPHKWVVTEKHKDIRQPMFEGRIQVNISECIYKRKAFQKSRRPRCWPADRPYPEDPMKVHNTSIKPCITCKSHYPCDCSFLDDRQVRPPLVELRDYGRKGVGVRALERIPRKTILAEYVGEVYPSNYDEDPIYSLDFSLPGRPNDEVIASISPKRYGNWARFINHSCDASTRFTTCTVGGRHKSVVQAVRDIEMFEEVTIDYGDAYWKHKVCECGVEGCYSRMMIKTEEKMEEERPESWDLSTVADQDWEAFEAAFEDELSAQMG